MNASVIASAKKNGARKPAVAAKPKPAGAVKKATGALKSGAKGGKPVVASAAKPATGRAVKPPTKSASVKPAKRPASTASKGAAARGAAPAPTKAAAVRKQAAATPAREANESTVVKARTESPAPATTGNSQPGILMSSNKASVETADNIEKPVVSKVSEVATKTSKSTATVEPEDGALLTEAQILKMSDKDYMNAAQLAFFRARLQQLEKDLLKNAGETTEHLRETVLVPDPADRATIEEEHALELRTRDRERKLLKKVQQSIAAIDAGDYGWCEETGEPIGIPRLLARPTATLSLEAQQRRELKQKLYGD